MISLKICHVKLGQETGGRGRGLAERNRKGGGRNPKASCRFRACRKGIKFTNDFTRNISYKISNINIYEIMTISVLLTQIRHARKEFMKVWKERKQLAEEERKKQDLK